MVEYWKTEGARCTKMGADTSSAEIPQMPQNLYAQFVCPSQESGISMKKKASLGVYSPGGNIFN